MLPSEVSQASFWCLSQFQLIFAYLLWPLAFGMGVPAEDCFKVGELVGIKTVLSEFIAFERLGK